MPIRIEHGKPSTLLTAAQMAGEARKQEEVQKMQMEFDYRQSLRQQDMQIDLQMQERSKLWEIQKMELRSQIDFQREEQLRQRKLDSIDSAIQQIDKEVLAGRITEQEAYPIKQKLEISKTGVSVPVSAFPGDEEERYGMPPWYTSPEWKDTPEGIAAREKAFPGDDEDRYGVRPYYTDPEFERDFPELAAAKKRDVTEGRAGTVPYHLSPEFLRTLPPSTAQEMLENKGIFFDSDEEFETWWVNLEGDTPTELPLGDKQLDMGIRVEGEEKTLNETQARLILERTGGDKERARQIARQMGYSF